MKYYIQDTTLTAIGDAIREKKSTSVEYNPLDMPDAIKSISGTLPDAEDYEFASWDRLVKGRIITMNLDGSDKQYFVLKINGSIAEVLLYTGFVETSFSRDYNNYYSGGELDVALNTTYYNTLSVEAKSAIVDKNVIQYEYIYSTEVFNETTHASYADYSTKTQKAVVGNRHIYAIGIEDIEEYFNNTFSVSDLDNLFPGHPTFTHLSSAMANNNDEVYSVRMMGINDRRVITLASLILGLSYPAFQIDLSKIAWR